MKARCTSETACLLRWTIDKKKMPTQRGHVKIALIRLAHMRRGEELRDNGKESLRSKPADFDQKKTFTSFIDSIKVK